MSNQGYERVAGTDTEEHAQPIPSSPPPSFHSRTSSFSSRRLVESSDHEELSNAFDADGSDSEEENDGDHRQRLMRGTPSPTSEDTDASGRPHLAERRTTQMPQFVPEQPSSTRVYGGGSGSDGVFANLTAKPESGEKIEEHPPTYAQAALDAAPPYWETTILAPGFGGSDEVYIEGLPVGSVFSFLWNGMISMSFQLVGFLLTYLLHTTHAAKNGSRAGLGVTLIQYGLYMRSSGKDGDGPGEDSYAGGTPQDPNSHDFDPNSLGSGAATTAQGNGTVGAATSEWFAYMLMIVGWFILIRAVSDFYRARKHEQLVLQSPERGLPIPVIAEGEGEEAV